MSIGPYDLDEEEVVAAAKEARDFVVTIPPWRILDGHGTYRQKRPGLGVVIHGYDANPSVEPPVWAVRYSIQAWRTAGEKRFGDSLLRFPLDSAPVL